MAKKIMVTGIITGTKSPILGLSGVWVGPGVGCCVAVGVGEAEGAVEGLGDGLGEVVGDELGEGVEVSIVK